MFKFIWVDRQALSIGFDSDKEPESDSEVKLLGAVQIEDGVLVF